MTPTCPEATAALKAGDLTAAIAAVKNAVRKNPGDPDLRFLLFQVIALAGDWDAASNHLVTYNELISRESPLPVLFNQLLEGEVQRLMVFTGELPPTVFGEPQPWIAYLIQALGHTRAGDHAAAAQLKAQAMEDAPAISGTINDIPFNWMMDGDSRFGPIIEAIIRGKYYWIPQDRIESLTTEAPSNIRDAVWVPANVMLTNGGNVHAFLPARYPGAHTWTEDALKLSRSTAWDEPHPGTYLGSGQRILMTDEDEISFLDIRQLSFTSAA